MATDKIRELEEEPSAKSPDLPLWTDAEDAFIFAAEGERTNRWDRVFWSWDAVASGPLLTTLAACALMSTPSIYLYPQAGPLPHSDLVPVKG